MSLTHENLSFLNSLSTEAKIEYIIDSRFSDDLFLVYDSESDKKYIMKIATLKKPKVDNITISAVRSVLTFLGDEEIQNRIRPESRRSYPKNKYNCRYSSRFLCYKDFFINKQYSKDGYAKTQFISIYEKVDGLNLKQYSNSFGLSIDELINIGYVLLTSLYILHKNKIVHRDIKPENIIYNEKEEWPSRVKYIDFDFSCSKNVGCISNPGTYEYCAESVISGNSTLDYELWEKADIVSVALTLFRLLIGDESKGTYFQYILPTTMEEAVEWVKNKISVFEKRELSEMSIGFGIFLVQFFDLDTNVEKTNISLISIIEMYKDTFKENIQNSLIQDFENEL